MLQSGASMFLIIILYVAALLSGNKAVAKTEAKAKASPQDQQEMMIAPVDDGNPNTSEFSGGYWTGGQYVGLDAYTVKSDPYYVPTSDGGWEERVDYLYTDSDMNKSDGSPLSYAVRELDRSVSQELLYITLSGVTLTFDLNAEGALGPVSDADLEQLNAWVVSQDGRAVQDTSIALVQQGNQQAEKEPFLNYYFVAMLVDTDPPVESASTIMGRRGKSLRATRTSLAPPLRGPADATFMKACWAPGNSFVSSSALFKPFAAGMPVQCFGCCGPGCLCIFNRNGQTIWGGPCATHDQCTRQNGNRPFVRPCLRSFALSVIFVIYRWSA